jgi:hypothetical protein
MHFQPNKLKPKTHPKQFVALEEQFAQGNSQAMHIDSVESVGSV